MQEIKLWNIEGESVNQISQSKLDYENRLEKWLIEDISILSNSLAVIGSQVITAYNKNCLLYTSPSPRDATLSRMPSSA